ncbi:hypothetical protein STEG23_015786 [Scotinomys teguina]
MMLRGRKSVRIHNDCTSEQLASVGITDTLKRVTSPPFPVTVRNKCQLTKSRENKVSCGRQKRASDPLELESQTVVSHHVCAGNQAQIFWKSSNVLD